MRQITVDIPLASMPAGFLPEELRAQSTRIRFRRLDLQGFLYTCVVPEEVTASLVKRLRAEKRRTNGTPVVAFREGRGVIRVGGEWLDEYDKDSAQSGVFSQLRALGRTQAFILRLPETVGDSLRITLVGSASSLKHVTAVLERLGIPYVVRKLTGFDEKAESPLSSLTAQQAKVLKLACSLGYYDIPRKVSTRRMADLLGLDEGTVGKHIRRAERHVMEWFMTLNE